MFQDGVVTKHEERLPNKLDRLRRWTFSPGRMIDERLADFRKLLGGRRTGKVAMLFAFAGQL